MSYSDFKTLDQIHKELGIIIQGENELYNHIEPVVLTQWFREVMKIAYTKAIRINAESSRQALIVDHVLLELTYVPISFFLGNAFNVDSNKGLTGNPDGIISKSENQLYITSPVVVLVEAKKSDLGSGLAQCIAEFEIDLHIIDGHDLNAIRTALNRKSQHIKLIMLRTMKGCELYAKPYGFALSTAYRRAI